MECTLAERRAAGLRGAVDDQAAERGGDVRHERQQVGRLYLTRLEKMS